MKKYLWIMIAGLLLMGYLFTVVLAEEEQAATAKNEYIGDNAKKCAMCHKDQVAAWSKWEMSKSWDKLSDEEKKKDECIKCHVTGYGQEGGWVSFEKTPQLVGVQCEACHGPMGAHMKVPMTDAEGRKAATKTPDEKNCLLCHIKDGNPNFVEFKYDEAVKSLADHFKPETE